MFRLYFKIKFPLNLEGFRINHSLFPRLAASQSGYLNFVILPLQRIDHSQEKDFDTPKKGTSGRRRMFLPGNRGSLSVAMLQLEDGGGVSPTESAGASVSKLFPSWPPCQFLLIQCRQLGGAILSL